MSCPAFTAVSVALVLGVVGVVGCSTGQPAREKTGVGESDETAELRQASATRYLGQIASGETKSYPYFNPPPYRTVGFTAKGGDTITVDVKSTDGGEPLALIATPTFDILATANGYPTTDPYSTQVVYAVPAGTTTRPYRIVFRNNTFEDATFAVTLTVSSPPPVTCSYDGQTYPSGVTFPATDDCNTCSCDSTGGVACTTTAVCACNPDQEPWRNYHGTTPEQCGTIIVMCMPDHPRWFQNPCGCGCELLVH